MFLLHDSETITNIDLGLTEVFVLFVEIDIGIIIHFYTYIEICAFPKFDLKLFVIKNVEKSIQS